LLAGRIGAEHAVGISTGRTQTALEARPHRTNAGNSVELKRSGAGHHLANRIHQRIASLAGEALEVVELDAGEAVGHLAGKKAVFVVEGVVADLAVSALDGIAVLAVRVGR
jgi:hypothetical protein